jgi:hypothetical protein
MRASIRDSQVFEALRPLEVVSYLRATGWTQQQDQPDKYSVWSRGGGVAAYEIVVPLTRWRDYALRMSEVLATLEAVERRSQLEILTDLSLSNADVIRIRTDLQDSGDGTIPLDEAVTLVERTRDALLAAACSAIEPRAYFPSRKFGPALDYVKGVKMGQTERGSYTVTVISKVAPVLRQAEMSTAEIEEPYERRVVTMLGGGIAKIRTAADVAASTGSLESFKEGLDVGVSANLCDALVGMSGEARLVRGLDFSFSWSRTRPQTQKQIPTHVSISPDSLPVIQEAGRVLRETSPREDFELQGIVVKLDRPIGAQTGLVTVLGFVEDKPHAIKMELGAEDYRQVILAHDRQVPILALGELVKEGRSYVLRKPREIRLIHSD